MFLTDPKFRKPLLYLLIHLLVNCSSPGIHSPIPIFISHPLNRKRKTYFMIFILFYFLYKTLGKRESVSFWFHLKSYTRTWPAYYNSHIEQACFSQILSSIAFYAVYTKSDAIVHIFTTNILREIERVNLNM